MFAQPVHNITQRSDLGTPLRLSDLRTRLCCPSVITAWLCRRRMVRVIPLFLSNKPTQRHVRHRVALSGYWTHSDNTELVSTVPKDAEYCTFHGLQYTA